MRILLLDDEELQLIRLEKEVRKVVSEDDEIFSYQNPLKALDEMKGKNLDIAFLDIEMGKLSGLELCRTLLEINPRTNVVFLTAYSDYAVDAWNTGASGFMLKPITPEGVQEQLQKLRYPFFLGRAEQ